MTLKVPVKWKLIILHMSCSISHLCASIRPNNQKVSGSNPGSPSCMPKCPWARHPKSLLMSSWYFAWQPLPSVHIHSVWIGECEKCCKWLCAVSRLEKRYRNASPFTITHLALLGVHFPSTKHTFLWHCHGCIKRMPTAQSRVFRGSEPQWLL